MLTPTKSRLSWLFLLSPYTTFIPSSHLSFRLRIFQWNISSFYLGALFSSNFEENSLVKLWRSLTFCVNKKTHTVRVNMEYVRYSTFLSSFRAAFWFPSVVVFKRLYKLSARLVLSSSLLILFGSICFSFSKSLFDQRGAFQTLWATAACLGLEMGVGRRKDPTAIALWRKNVRREIGG